MTTIQARFPGTCPECGGRWAEGDLIRIIPNDQRPGFWRHAVCPDDPADPSLKPGESVCQSCWLVHPEGACDR